MENVENRKKIGRAGSMNPPHAPQGRARTPAAPPPPHAPWPRVKLGEVCEIIGGGTPSKSHPEYFDGDIPWVTVRDMVTEKIDKTERTITKIGLENSATNIIKAGNIIISTHVGLGKVCYLLHDSAINQDLKGIVPRKNNLSVDYLYWIFRINADYLIKQGQGSTVKGVRLSVVEDLSFPLPPLPEQRAIVAKLERELAAVDAMEKKFKEMEKTAETAFKAELKEAFDEVSRGGAETRRLGEIGHVVTGGTPSKCHHEYYHGIYPLYKPSDLNQGINTISSDDSLSEAGWNVCRQLPKDTVLVTCIGATLGKTGVIRSEGSCNQQINALICKKVLPDFAYYWFVSPKFQGQLWSSAHAATLPIVNKSEFSHKSIPVPDIPTQRAIVARLDAARERKEKLVAAARKGAETAALLRKALLKEAFE